MKRVHYILTAALVGLVLSISAGCGDDAAPVNSGDVDSLDVLLAQTPMPDERAELMAVQYSGELVAPRELYRRFHRDLNDIENKYRDLIVSYIDSMGYREYFIDERGDPHFPFFPVYRGHISGELFMNELDGARLLAGEHEQFNELVDRLGLSWDLDRTWEHPGYGIVIFFDLNERLHPQRTLDLVAEVEGVVGVSYASIYPDGFSEDFTCAVRPSIWAFEDENGGYSYILYCTDLNFEAALYFRVSRAGVIRLEDVLPWQRAASPNREDHPWFGIRMAQSSRELSDLSFYSVSGK